MLAGTAHAGQPAVTPSPDASAALQPSTVAGLAQPIVVLDGPPPPVPPAVISRDAAGRATVRAVRLTGSLRLDGTLDENVYTDVLALSDFAQQEPNEGAPATEKTEAWVLFDDNNIYVSVRAWDSAPESQWIVNEMRRDNFAILQNEGIQLSFDTFYDRRNAVIFNVTAIGGRMDGQATDERSWNGDWNPIWDVRTGRFEGGWTMEAAIPFESLRYRPGGAQTWGFNIRRVVRWKNEMSSLTPWRTARSSSRSIDSSGSEPGGWACRAVRHARVTRPLPGAGGHVAVVHAYGAAKPYRSRSTVSALIDRRLHPRKELGFDRTALPEPAACGERVGVLVRERVDECQLSWGPDQRVVYSIESRIQNCARKGIPKEDHRDVIRYATR